MKRTITVGATAVALAGIAAIFVIAFRNIESNPPLWWDEGWTLSVARNWVEQGHYGLYLSGKPVPPTLAAHFPVVAPIAISFKLFGVGIVQARAVGLLYTALAMALLFELTRRLYGLRPAWAALAIVVLSPPEWYMHPVHVGRQVIGEMPSVLYLLAGYLAFVLADRRPRICSAFAILFWAIALMTKAQVMPFWLASMLAPLLALAWKRQWRVAGHVALCLAASLSLSYLLAVVKDAALAPYTVHSGPSIRGLTEASALVFSSDVRRTALRFTFYCLFPASVALLYATCAFTLRDARRNAFDTVNVAHLMMLTLAGSWLGWFVACSVGWPRFVFPAWFLATPLVAYTLSDLTSGFTLPAVTRPGGALKSLLAIILFAVLCRKGTLEYARYQESVEDRSAQQVAQFINMETPPNTEIETYESELLFFLKRTYHYPPPQLDVDYIRRNWGDADTPLRYDLSTVHAEYLVVGIFGDEVYAPLIAAGKYQPMRSIGRYTVYHKSR